MHIFSPASFHISVYKSQYVSTEMIFDWFCRIICAWRTFGSSSGAVAVPSYVPTKFRLPELTTSGPLTAKVRLFCATFSNVCIQVFLFVLGAEGEFQFLQLAVRLKFQIEFLGFFQTNHLIINSFHRWTLPLCDHCTATLFYGLWRFYSHVRQ